MVDKKALRDIYIIFLEEDIIKNLAEKIKVDNRNAMEKYYSSKLCKQIHDGSFGIEYMDPKYLVSDLLENESELFITHQ